MAYPDSMNLDGHTDYVVDYGDTLSEPMTTLGEAQEVAGRYSPELPVYRRSWVGVRATDQRFLPGTRLSDLGSARLPLHVGNLSSAYDEVCTSRKA